MRLIWLKGDYVGRHERQQAASKAGCDFVICFHFNSFNDPRASGAEVYHNNKGNAKTIAEQLLTAITDVLKNRPRGVKDAQGSRAGFIRHYHCPAVLIEPCFVSNPDEAAKVHDVDTLRALGEAIASVVWKWFPAKAVIGLDIGHKFKRSNPDDRGAKCVLGDWEADHAERLAKVVAASLTQRGEKK
jgi:hypothetical protein